MSTNYSAPIERLSRDYFLGHISGEEYRKQRKAIIDQMEREYNGVDRQTESDDQSNLEDLIDPDITINN